MADTTLPTCQCVAGQAPVDKLNSIYCALATIAQNAGPTVEQLVALGALNYGEIRDFAGSTAPTGWLLSFGQAVSRATYANLFAVIGTTYGAGDGTTTFNLPDLRGRVSAGKDNMGGVSANRLTGTLPGGIDGDTLGNVGGEEGNLLTLSEVPTTLITNLAPGLLIAEGVDASYNVNDSGGNSHNNVQPTIVLNKIIFTGV